MQSNIKATPRHGLQTPHGGVTHLFGGNTKIPGPAVDDVRVERATGSPGHPGNQQGDAPCK